MCNVANPGLTGGESCADGACDQDGRCRPAIVCGNSVLQAGEGCDDGNDLAGDGCNTSCLIEDNFACNQDFPGFTDNSSCASGDCVYPNGNVVGVCEPASSCGNGVLEAGEGCDDENNDGG